jgi:hypothetical protein
VLQLDRPKSEEKIRGDRQAMAQAEAKSNSGGIQT